MRHFQRDADASSRLAGCCPGPDNCQDDVAELREELSRLRAALGQAVALVDKIPGNQLIVDAWATLLRGEEAT